MFDVKNKVALITGAATGIGFGYVKELLRNDAKGVALIDINENNGNQALEEVTKIFGENRAIFIKADITNRNEFEGAFEATVKAFGELDIVINNAGILQEIQWEKCVAVNLIGVITGTMLAIEQYFPKYKSGGECVVLNTASRAGLRPSQAIPAYTATKHGVVGFTRAVGTDLRCQHTNVRVIAICPCLTNTSLIKLTEEQIGEPYRSFYLTKMQTEFLLTVEDLAKHAVELIKNASNGSVWFANENGCNEIDFTNFD